MKIREGEILCNYVTPVGLAEHQSWVDRVEVSLHFSAGCLWLTHTHTQPISLTWHLFITFIQLAETFIQRDLQIEEYNKQFIVKRQIDTGSACNTKCQALFRVSTS